MRLTVVGCSGSLPVPRNPASCYLLEADGFRLVVDLGSGALGALQQYIGLNDVDAVCLSHLHADHFIDMCSFWVARTYSPDGPQPRIPVYGPAAAAERVHPVETFAFRFEHGGRVLTYSGDTGPSPVLVELAGSADVLLCEAGFPEEPDLPPGLHLTGRQAGQHATAAGAGQLILTHIAPDTDPARSLAEAQSTFPGPISLAVPGLVLDL